MVIFNKKWKKNNEIQLTKNIMDLNIRKMTNHPPSPDIFFNNNNNNNEAEDKLKVGKISLGIYPPIGE